MGVMCGLWGRNTLRHSKLCRLLRRSPVGYKAPGLGSAGTTNSQPAEAAPGPCCSLAAPGSCSLCTFTPETAILGRSPLTLHSICSWEILPYMSCGFNPSPGLAVVGQVTRPGTEAPDLAFSLQSAPLALRVALTTWGFAVCSTLPMQ